MTNTLMAEIGHLRAQVAALTMAHHTTGLNAPGQEQAQAPDANTQQLFVPMAKAPPQVPHVTRAQSQAPPWTMHETPTNLPPSRTPAEHVITTTEEYQTILLALTPDEQPPNLHGHLFRNAKEALLILSSSPRLTTVQQQELRDIVRILNTMCP